MFSTCPTLVRFYPNCLAFLFFLSLQLAANTAPVSAEVASVKISAKFYLDLAGLRFGKIYLNSVLENGTYSVIIEAKNSRLGKLVNYGGMTTSSGKFSQSGTAPEQFSVNYQIRKKQEAITLSYDGNSVENIEIVPPRAPSNNRIPILEEHRQNVIDPVGAFVFPLPDQSLTGETACNRELAVFDGRNRYNLTLFYIRTERANSNDYSGQLADVSDIGSTSEFPILATKTFVCGMNYAPIAGHRIKDKDDFFKWANSDGVEIWLLPLEQAGVLLPYRGVFPTPLGRAIFRLNELSVN